MMFSYKYEGFSVGMKHMLFIDYDANLNETRCIVLHAEYT